MLVPVVHVWGFILYIHVLHVVLRTPKLLLYVKVTANDYDVDLCEWFSFWVGFYMFFNITFFMMLLTTFICSLFKLYTVSVRVKFYFVDVVVFLSWSHCTKNYRSSHSGFNCFWYLRRFGRVYGTKYLTFTHQNTKEKRKKFSRDRWLYKINQYYEGRSLAPCLRIVGVWLSLY